MTDATEDRGADTGRRSKISLVVAICALALGGGSGFWATYSGMVDSFLSGKQQHEPQKKTDALPDITFVEVEPLTISLRGPSQGRHLRFRAQLEVPTAYASDVESLLPRVVDVLNGYLRALEPADLEDSASLTRLRSQMLRRVQMVCGNKRVNDLLIMEFILS